jgi:hypothetical protein
METINTEKRNQRKQKMEGYPIHMDWQNQYCENGYTTESNLYVQCNPYQNFNDILHKDKLLLGVLYSWS